MQANQSHSSSEIFSLKREVSLQSTRPERLLELARQSAELARIVAKNPRATASILEELAYSQDSLTRQTVVANPNSPVKILLHLGGEFPQTLLENPVFGLLWLENPDLLSAMPSQTLSRLLECPRGQEELLETVANVGSRSLRYNAERVLRNPNCAVTWLERFADSNYREIRSAIADNPQAPPSLLVKFAEDGASEVRRSVSRNSSTPVDLLAKLAEDPSSDVRANIARNSRTPAEILERLARDRDSSVRYLVARHSCTPTAILEAYAAEQDVNLRCALTQNPQLSVALLEQLARSPETSIKTAVASHARAPVPLVLQLLSEGAKWFRGDVARYSHCREVLERLARDWEPWVRQRVAENPQTPIALLAKLANDETFEVRFQVAQHPQTSAEVLANLARDRYFKIRTEVANHPNTESAILERLAGDRKSPVVRAARSRLQKQANLKPSP